MKDRIIIRNARQHNLKGIDVDIPRRSLVVVTGPSGSGKSTLAFDTLYAEGQRRYVESLSTYAKQFLDRMEKPAVDLIEGLSPAVAIEQTNPTRTSRSTVGTATETYDYLRLLWARAGRTHCPVCERRVVPDTVQSATDAVLSLPEGTRLLVAFPLPRSERVKHATIVENLRALGFLRVLVGDAVHDLDEPAMADAGSAPADLAKADDLLVIGDRLILRHGTEHEEADMPESGPGAASAMRDRVADSLGTAFREGDGEAVVVVLPDRRRMLFSERFHCPDHPEIAFLEPSPRLFSFNNPYGSCPTCTGFGATLEYDPDLIVPVASRSLKEGAVDPWEKPRYKRYRTDLLAFAKEKEVSVDTPWSDLPKSFRDEVVNGRRRGFQGVIPFLRSREKKRYKQYIRVFLRQYQSARPCAGCGGARLRPEALYVKLGGLDIGAAAALPVRELRAWLDELLGGGTAVPLSPQEHGVADAIARELGARVRFLDDVGLGYLTLDRQTRTLSGGEAQRIALANSLGSHLVDTLYVLDEPTIGLHPRDTDRLLGLLTALRDRGNCVVVVEHDPAAIAAADHVLELGPGSGEKGGTVVFQGDYGALQRADTATGRYVSGREPAPQAPKRRPTRNWLKLRGARQHNVRGADIDIPLGELTVVTGVSGSGKSTLVHDVLYRALEARLAGETSAKRHLGEVVGRYDDIEGLRTVDAVVLVDQSPIGKSHRSNPVTYIKAFDQIRDIFAQQPLSKQRGYTPGHFSFNVKGGRCEACQGEGVVQVEMVFLADVYLPCDTCGGARYRRETLEVRHKGLNIREVLDLTVDEAIRFFLREDRLGQMLWQLQQVGLGYLRLGQPAPTLSGGEAQRLKIARELIGAFRRRGHRFYILDEPTTGLSGGEVRRLIGVLRRLTDGGHTVAVIEHNVDVMAAADWIIDMGPEAGDAGGRVVAMGRPEEVMEAKDSHTAAYLREALETARSRAGTAS